MRFLREIILQITALFRTRNIAGEIDAEVAQHLEFATADFIEDGMSPKEARLAALRKFGNVEAYKDRTRDSWGTRGVLDTLRDFKFGLRLCVRYRSSSVMAIVVLAIGIALSTIMFTVSTKFLGTDILEDNQVIRVTWEIGESYSKQISVLDFKRFREEITLLENLVGIQSSTFWLARPGHEENEKQYSGARISPELFDRSNVSPILGRLFSDTSVVRGVLISESVWSGFFNREENTVGSRINLNGEECEVVGVMPAGFTLAGMQQVWLATDWEEFDDTPRALAPIVAVGGTLKRGATVEQVKVELEALASQLALQYPDTNKDYTKVRLDVPEARFINSNGLVTWSLILLGSLLVLAMTCTNAFNIIMTRTANRTHELAARYALGAKRSHVLWQVIVDGLTLSGIGTALGVGLAMGGLHFATRFFEGFDQPGLHLFSMNTWVVLFAVLAAVASGVGSSIIPALRASRMDPFALLKDDSRSSSGIYIGWLSRVTVVSQIAFSAVVVYFSVGLLFSSYAIASLDVSFDKNTVLAAKTELWADPNIRTPQDVLDTYAELKQILENVSGVEAVSMTSKSFGIMASGWMEYELEGQAEASLFSWNRVIPTSVTPDYLEVFGIEIVSGRMIQDTDTEDSLPVCVVTEEFVKFRCNGVDPVGSRLKIEDGKTSDWITIVGVVPGLKPVVPDSKDEIDLFYAEILFPFAQRMNWNPTLLLSAPDASTSFYRKAIRDALEEVAPLVLMRGDVITIGERISMGGRFAKGASTASDVFGISILLTSLIGLYSIVSFTTSQRRKEFGIRIALGSPRWIIVYSVLKPWLITIASGLGLAAFVLAATIGIYLSYAEAVSELNQSTFSMWKDYGVLFLITAMIVCTTSLLAMAMPAWRSTRIDPMEVIRAE